MRELKKGDYVVATKYSDGDPQDHWCVGFYECALDYKVGERFLIVDDNGTPFRANGFRRVKKISRDRGKWLLDHMKEIEQSGKSVWFWVRSKIKE